MLADENERVPSGPGLTCFQRSARRSQQGANKQRNYFKQKPFELHTQMLEEKDEEVDGC